MVSNINELVDEAVEIASQDFASVKVEKGEKAIKQEFLYLVKKIFSEKEFKLNPDGHYSDGFRVHENGGNAFYSSSGTLLLTFFSCVSFNSGFGKDVNGKPVGIDKDIQFNPLKVRNAGEYYDVDVTYYYPLKIEVFSPKVFEKAQIFTKAYEHISGQKATIIKQFHEEEHNPELEKIISSSDQRVKVSESSHFRIARWLKEAGYELANLEGYSTDESNEKGIGILKSRGRSFFGFKKVSYYLGNILFDFHDHWYVTVHGKEFLNEVTGLVTNLSKREGISGVEIALQSEKSRLKSKPLVHY